MIKKQYFIILLFVFVFSSIIAVVIKGIIPNINERLVVYSINKITFALISISLTGLIVYCIPIKHIEINIWFFIFKSIIIFSTILIFGYLIVIKGSLFKIEVNYVLILFELLLLVCLIVSIFINHSLNLTVVILNLIYIFISRVLFLIITIIFYSKFLLYLSSLLFN